MKHIHFAKQLAVSALALTLVVSLAACGKNDPAPDINSGSSISDSNIDFYNLLPEYEQSARLRLNPPSKTILEKYDTAYEMNNDVVGWLTVANTTIDDAVLQAEDNEYYERKNITKAYDFQGCYWADYEVLMGDRRSISRNTVIYGHSMQDDPNDIHFSQLKKYLDIEFAKANPYITFSTETDEMQWEIFSVMYTDIYLPYHMPNVSDEQFDTLLQEMKARSNYTYDVEVSNKDKIIVLSTCTYPTGNKEVDDQYRFVICAKLVNADEPLKEEAVLTENSNPKKPEIHK